MAKTRRGRKRKTKVETSPLSVVPPAPEDLGQYGREYWESLAPQLVELGILKPLHLETFRVLCECWQEYRTLHAWLLEDPERLTFTTSQGYTAETPQLRQRDKALASLQKLWLKFGLTPHALATLNKGSGKGVNNALPAIAEFAKRKYAE
ncbi:MAG: phage terminase small subunit P27 family [Pirellulales bacterium]